MIKGIFFDAADVFYRRPQPTLKYVLNLLKEKGLAAELSEEDRQRHQVLRSRAMSGHLSPDQYWDQLLLMHGVADPDERRILVGKINDYSNQVQPIPGGREAAAGLKRRGFILGIITDTLYPVEWKMRWLAKVGVAEFMDVVACSTVLGAHKPDPVMYLNAVQQAHLTPAESAFVGHDAQELEGARRAGLVTVAVNYDPGAQADYYCQSMFDLLNVPIFQNHIHNTEEEYGSRN